MGNRLRLARGGASCADARRTSRPVSRPTLLSAEQCEYVLQGFQTLVPVDATVERRLGELVAETLDHPGSMVRAQLAFGILTGHGFDVKRALQVGVAIEYFHTASLIFDDLPGMDDATERRGRPCPHRVHGEGTAMLGALGLINRGYELLWGVFSTLDPERAVRAMRLVCSCLGLGGILSGQSRDLHFREHERNERDVMEAAEGKTVSLIRLGLVLPAMVAGAGEVALHRLERLATVWGLGYQILDDFKDCLMSSEDTGKTTARDRALGRPNLPAVIGSRAGMLRLKTLIAEGRDIVNRFPGDRWRHLDRLQRLIEGECSRLAPRIAVPA